MVRQAHQPWFDKLTNRVRYQEYGYLHGLCCLTRATTDFFCDTCVSPKQLALFVI